MEKTRKKKGTFSEEDWPIWVSVLINPDGNPIIPRCHTGTYITLSRWTAISYSNKATVESWTFYFLLYGDGIRYVLSNLASTKYSTELYKVKGMMFSPYGDNFMRSLRRGRWRGEKGRLRKLSRVSSWRLCFIDCDEMVRLYSLQQGTMSAQESSWLSACLNTVTVSDTSKNAAMFPPSRQKFLAIHSQNRFQI